MTQEKNIGNVYLQFIAYLQIIGIILVVLGHSFHEYPDGYGGSSLLLYRMIYSFHMPLFVFLSGFLMIFTTRTRNFRAPGIWDFTRKKVLRLLLPFVVLTLVTFIPRVLLSDYADDAKELTLTAFARAFIYHRDLVHPYLWFLQVIFTLLVLSYIFINLLEKTHAGHKAVYLTLLLFFIIARSRVFDFTDVFSFGETLYLGVFFAAGILFCHYMPQIDRYIRWTSPAVFAGFGAGWAVLFFLTENTPYDVFCSFAGISMCVSLARILEARDIHLLDHLHGANYLIFLTSWYMNVLTQQILHHFTDFPWWLYTILSLTAGIYVPWLGYRWLRKHRDSRWARVCAFLLGQSWVRAGSENLT